MRIAEEVSDPSASFLNLATLLKADLSKQM
jgi:hypothetical protein